MAKQSDARVTGFDTQGTMSSVSDRDMESNIKETQRQEKKIPKNNLGMGTDKPISQIKGSVRNSTKATDEGRREHQPKHCDNNGHDEATYQSVINNVNNVQK